MQLVEKLASGQELLGQWQDAAFTRLDFDWAGSRFHAQSTPRPCQTGGQGTGGCISLSATLGQVPFTAEDALARRTVLDSLRAANRTGGGLYIAQRGRVCYESRTETETLAAGGELIAALTLIMLSEAVRLGPLQAHLRPLVPGASIHADAA